MLIALEFSVIDLQFWNYVAIGHSWAWYKNKQELQLPNIIENNDIGKYEGSNVDSEEKYALATTCSPV